MTTREPIVETVKSMEKQNELGVAGITPPLTTPVAVAPSGLPDQGASIANAPAHWLTVTKVNRYKCVHCGRVGYSAGHMRKHAKRCTANPDRKCGMHYREHLFDGGSRFFDGYDVKDRVQAAMQILPDPAKYFVGNDEFGFGQHPGLQEALIAVMPEVSNAVDGCPACTLAALRQKRIPYMLEVFDFKKACEVWKDQANNGWTE